MGLKEAAAYVALCEQLECGDGQHDGSIEDRLDQLWYGEMSPEDRIAAQCRLAVRRAPLSDADVLDRLAREIRSNGAQGARG